MSDKDGLGQIGRGAWRRIRRTLTADLSRTPLRELTLRGPAPPGLVARPAFVRPGDPEIGARLLDGLFEFGAERLDVGRDGAPWTVAAPSPAFFAWLHGFDWLRHILAAEDEAASSRARALTDAWIDAFGRWHDQAWGDAVTARRLHAWLAAADALLGDDRAPVRLDALARQARHLDRAAASAANPIVKLTGAVAVATAGSCLEDGDKLKESGLALAAMECDRQILPDGGHLGRSPAVVAELLADLAALDGALAGLGVEPPAPVRRAVDRMTPMLRFFRLGDGGTTSFHGAGEGDRGMIAATLARDDAGGRAFGFAPHTGYHRVEAGGSVLILDAGAPPAGAEAFASCLAFEFAPRSERLIVNAGWSSDQPEGVRAAARAPAAHSTLDLTPAKLAKSGRLDYGAVQARRNEEEAGVWIEGSHEAWRQSDGLVHRRRIYLSSDGKDLRGEDTLFRPVDDPLPDGVVPARFAIRFLLHPDVKPEPTREPSTVRLTLASGEAWRFRTDAGPVALADGVYYAAGAPARPTRLITILGAARADGPLERPPNRVRWALKRLGRAPQA